MAYKISDDCIKCGACASECPQECITEGDDKFVIDADKCISFGDHAVLMRQRLQVVAHDAPVARAVVRDDVMLIVLAQILAR